jgi:hypothetical protein
LGHDLAALWGTRELIDKENPTAPVANAAFAKDAFLASAFYFLPTPSGKNRSSAGTS